MQTINPKMGYAYGFGAFIIWGLFPFFFKNLESVPALEIIAHRVLWSGIGAAVLLFFWKHPGWWRELCQNPSRFAILTVSGLLIASNWLVYVWAVNHDQMIAASLGYYINPLVSVLLSLIFLREKLRNWQWIAVGFATLGVTIQVYQLGELPWISLALALSFGIYGLIRKQAPIDALPGLAIETWLLLPVVALWLAFTPNKMLEADFWSSSEALWLIAAGPVTLIPLIFFNLAARSIPLSSLAFMQYLAPTLVLLQAIFIYHETFSMTSMFAFSCIWIALFIYTVDLLRVVRFRTRV